MANYPRNARTLDPVRTVLVGDADHTPADGHITLNARPAFEDDGVGLRHGCKGESSKDKDGQKVLNTHVTPPIEGFWPGWRLQYLYSIVLAPGGPFKIFLSVAKELLPCRSAARTGGFKRRRRTVYSDELQNMMQNQSVLPFIIITPFGS